MSEKIVFAIAAHPDDIEFMMAGTLVLLAEAGYALHMMNVANGCCGSMRMGREETAATRWREAQESARLLGATIHPPIAEDLEIFYEPLQLKRLAAVIREVRPSIVLTHSPQDYMEDHMNTARLAMTAAFSRGMPNFITVPPRPALEGEVTLYHALPHGLRDMMGQLVRPDIVVDVGTAMDRKRQALAAHRSQKDWLDATQGMGSYVQAMEDLCREAAQRYAPGFDFAEGWRRHSHLGFCAAEDDPLSDALGEHITRAV